MRSCPLAHLVRELVIVASALALMPPALGASANAGRAPAVCSSDASRLPAASARLLSVGDYRGPFASRVEQSQKFFDQGLVFGWGFNFPEAVRSFSAAARLDPACALCRWGIAWALGPSINHDMQPAEVPPALDAIAQARANSVAGSRERALIDALANRYSSKQGGDEDALARSYATSMRALALRYAADPDIAVLAAEATMIAHAYDYWHVDGRAKPWTPQIIAWLDGALKLAPDHPGAHHYRIHLFEDSRQPERALASAEKLGSLAPLAGHLVHMPSHIFFRLGRYRDAVAANRAAVLADRAYADASGTVSDYARHNLHHLWASALWASDSASALDAADRLAESERTSAVRSQTDALSQHLLAAPLLTRVRLRQWEAIGAHAGSSRAVASETYLSGLTQFARGMALAARGDIAAAIAELASLKRTARAVAADQLTVKNINQASAVLSVAGSLLASSISTARNMRADAVRYARLAVAAEDRLASDDPPLWPVPARHALGAALLHANRPSEARNVYRADLTRHPDNCVAIAGLAIAERALHTTPAATARIAQNFAPHVHCPE